MWRVEMCRGPGRAGHTTHKCVGEAARLLCLSQVRNLHNCFLDKRDWDNYTWDRSTQVLGLHFYSQQLHSWQCVNCWLFTNSHLLRPEWVVQTDSPTRTNKSTRAGTLGPPRHSKTYLSRLIYNVTSWITSKCNGTVQVQLIYFC